MLLEYKNQAMIRLTRFGKKSILMEMENYLKYNLMP